jgi:hypothetical protein
MVQAFRRHVISPFTSSCFFRHPSDNIKFPELLRLLQKYQTQGVCPWCQQTKEMEAGNVNRRWCGKFWWRAGIQYLNSMNDVWRLPVSVRVELGYMRDIYLCVRESRCFIQSLRTGENFWSDHKNKFLWWGNVASLASIELFEACGLPISTAIERKYREFLILANTAFEVGC